MEHPLKKPYFTAAVLHNEPILRLISMEYLEAEIFITRPPLDEDRGTSDMYGILYMISITPTRLTV